MAASFTAGAACFQVTIPCASAITQLDALSVCAQAAQECGFNCTQEAAGTLVLTPIAPPSSADGWKRASMLIREAFTGGARRGSALEGARGVRLSAASASRVESGTLRVELRPTDCEEGHGLAVSVCAADAAAGGLFVAALGKRFEQQFGDSATDHGCDGHLEDFLASAEKEDLGKETVKEMCRRKSLHDWYGRSHSPSDTPAPRSPSRSFSECPLPERKSLVMTAQRSVMDWYKDGTQSAFAEGTGSEECGGASFTVADIRNRDTDSAQPGGLDVSPAAGKQASH